MLVKKLALLTSALLLSSCAVGPDWMRPDAPGDAGYTTGDQKTVTSSSDTVGGTAQNFAVGAQIPGEWWQLFHNDTLNAYVVEAMKNNPSLDAAAASLREAHEAVAAGRGAFYPQISGSANVTRSKNTTAEFGGGSSSSAIPFNLLYTVYDSTVSASYNVDVWGGTRRQVESEEATEEYQRYELEADYLTLTSNVVAAAVEDASLRAQIAATEDIIKIDSDALKILNSQFELGAVAKTDVLTEQTTVAQAKALLPPLRKQLAQTRNELMALMGRFPNQDDGAGFDLEKLTLPVDLPVSLPSDLVNQRPDIRAAEAQLHSAQAELGVATANMLPQLSLSASYGIESTSTGTLFSPGNDLWNLGAGLTQPIFEGFTLLYQKREAEAAYDAALANYKATVIGAFQNVADALRAVESDADALAASKEAADSAAQSLKIAQMQFDAGSLTYLLLLTSQQQYQQTRLALAQAEAQRYADTAALFQALGGGWWSRVDIPETDESDYRARKRAENPAQAAKDLK
jgi:NodT family efflux transporter outer membrane factor (OMF) lipoprotein